jgi:hypothetical protein
MRLSASWAPLVEDAAALVRILAESVVNAAFIAVSDETMALRFDAWGDFMQAKQEQWSLEAFPKSTPEEQAKAVASIDQLKAQALQEFPDFAKQRGLGFWKHLPDRAKVIDEALGQRDFAMLNETWRTLSNYVHQSALALRQRIFEDQDGVAVGRAYTSEDAANVLFACNESLLYPSDHEVYHVVGVALGADAIHVPLLEALGLYPEIWQLSPKLSGN